MTGAPWPVQTGPDPVAEQGRVCALAVRGVRDLQGVTAAHPELFDAAPFDPALFDPERFAPELPRRRYRYSYFPFGGGPHQCLGQYLFLLEAQLIVSTVLSRYRFRLRGPVDLTPRMGASLQPKQRAELILTPVAGTVVP